MSNPTWFAQGRPKFTQVWYHANCNDGLVAAVIVHQLSKGWRQPPTFTAVQYGQDPPPCTDDDMVLIVDFSYKKEVLDMLTDRGVAWFVIDHHKTAAEELRSFTRDYVWFEQEYSGAHMTWSYINPEDPHPKLVQYVQDRDLWRFDLPDSQPINAVLRTQPKHFSVWEELMLELEIRTYRKEMAKTGQILLNAQNDIVSSIAWKAVPILLAGEPVWAVNASVYFSEIAHSIAERRAPEGCVCGAVYFLRDDGKMQFSLRSMDGVDCSHIARHYGGGGHAQACGFEIPPRDFLDIFEGGLHGKGKS